eukprot:403366416
MNKSKSIKNLQNVLRGSIDGLKTKEIIEENKIEAVRFFDQTSEKLNMLIVNVNERFEVDLKQKLMDTFGKDFGQEAVLNRFDDFIEYLNRITRGPIKRFLGIHEFDKQLFKDAFKYDFSQYGSKQQFYNMLLNQEESGGTSDAHVNFQLSGKIDIFSIGKDKFLLTITIGDYLQIMTAGIKTITKKKLKHFMMAIRKVLEKVIAFGGKYQLNQISYQLKGMILFKKEDFTTSSILDYEVDSTDPDCLFTFEKLQ